MQQLAKLKLPENAIARYPCNERSESRLMVVDLVKQRHHHHHFYDLPQFVKPGDLLVMNNTRVINARLLGNKATGGSVECLIERALDGHQALCFIKANRSPKTGCVLHFGKRCATLLEKQGHFWVIAFEDLIDEVLAEEGHVPIPPYLKREDEAIDQIRYQTVYAKEPGAVAAPTAGLHFDEALIDQLKENGVDIAYITLHVGSGTFKPIDLDAPLPETLHEERYHIAQETADKWQHVRANGGRVIAVGTTALRALESAFDKESEQLNVGNSTTELFIQPGDPLHTIDGLITNFHLPDSSLMFLVAALMGIDTTYKLYQEAIACDYRFYSYGDAMLILRT